jgi:hypothetical protein
MLMVCEAERNPKDKKLDKTRRMDNPLLMKVMVEIIIRKVVFDR